MDIAGTYRHFKGGIYEAVGIARHSETEEELVVYRSPAGDLWVRPKDMFFGTAMADGIEVTRFARIEDAPGSSATGTLAER
jgi:hypothetical protein